MRRRGQPVRFGWTEHRIISVWRITLMMSTFAPHCWYITPCYGYIFFSHFCVCVCSMCARLWMIAKKFIWIIKCHYLPLYVFCFGEFFCFVAFFVHTIFSLVHLVHGHMAVPLFFFAFVHFCFFVFLCFYSCYYIVTSCTVHELWDLYVYVGNMSADMNYYGAFDVCVFQCLFLIYRSKFVKKT